MYPITKKAAAVTTEMPAENGANIRLIMPNKYINAENSIILPFLPTQSFHQLVSRNR